MQEDSGNRNIDPAGLARFSFADPSPRLPHFPSSNFSSNPPRGIFRGGVSCRARPGPIANRIGPNAVVAKRRGDVE